ncbi:MAG: stage sporulation protein [Frankiales bacterium]|nr:stage sporulation protein [Frankiales bacterium]
MVLPVPTGDRGLKFRALGFPVRVDPFFFLIMGFLGIGGAYGVHGPQAIAVFVAVAFAAVLAHELGHAVAARASGHSASIVLYGFGGATTHRGPALSRGRGALISFAGPAVGLAIGLPLFFARDALPSYGYGRYIAVTAIFLTLGLSVLNLLPILPLDGGQLLANALPGDSYTRTRTAAGVGVVVAAAAGAAAYAAGLTFSLVLAAWLVFGNIMTLREQRPRVVMSVRELENAAVSLIDAGRVDQAIHLIITSPVRDELDPAVIGLVRVANGDPAGWDVVVAAADEAPHDQQRAACLVRAAVARADWDALLARRHLDPALLRWAADRAVLAGREDIAERLAPTAR